MVLGMKTASRNSRVWESKPIKPSRRPQYCAVIVWLTDKASSTLATVTHYNFQPPEHLTLLIQKSDILRLSAVPCKILWYHSSEIVFNRGFFLSTTKCSQSPHICVIDFFSFPLQYLLFICRQLCSTTKPAPLWKSKTALTFETF